jgi:hypothetical protein
VKEGRAMEKSIESIDDKTLEQELLKLYSLAPDKNKILEILIALQDKQSKQEPLMYSSEITYNCL